MKIVNYATDVILTSNIKIARDSMIIVRCSSYTGYVKNRTKENI